MLSTILSVFIFTSLVHALGAYVDLAAVGPSTTLSAKSTICNVLDYGAVANNSTDIGPAITSAFSKCASKGNAILYIPPGSYSIATGVTLSGGSNWAMQIDGLITLTSDGDFGGNAIVIEKGSDIEVFSSNSLGAINGQGYITRLTSSSQNARLFRFISCSDISFHDIILVDSPTFHLVFNEVSNMEAYHITIRGPDLGGTDGIDVTCTDNCYLHDIEVTNRDECISVKSPSNNVLIEDIFCNQSGGMSIGSLTADITDSSDAAAVSNITMRNINVFQNTQMLMIKTFPGGNGSTGYVQNGLFENFWSYDTTYALDVDQYWESHTTPNTGGVGLSSLTFTNFTGTMNNGAERGAIVIRGSDQVPATDITLQDFSMWTVNGDKVINQCKNVYGTGYCAAKSVAGESLTTFTTSVTTTAAPSGFTQPVSPVWGVPGYGVTVPIPVYTPAVFWAAEGVSTKNTVTSTSTSTSGKSVQTSTPTATSVSEKTTQASMPTATSISEKTTQTSTPTATSISGKTTQTSTRTSTSASEKSTKVSTSTSASEKTIKASTSTLAPPSTPSSTSEKSKVTPTTTSSSAVRNSTRTPTASVPTSSTFVKTGHSHSHTHVSSSSPVIPHTASTLQTTTSKTTSIAAVTTSAISGGDGNNVCEW